MSSSANPSIIKRKSYVELVLLFVLIFIGSDWLANTFSSIWLNLAIGALFFPIIGALLPKSWKRSDVHPNYLAPKHPNMVLMFSIVFFAIAVGFFVSAVDPVISENGALQPCKWALISGVILCTAIELLKIWLKVRNVSVPNE